MSATNKRAGLVESTLHRLFMRPVHVLDIQDIGKAYRILTLGGESLRDVTWTPGDKIQIQLGGWVQRTYTPMDWDAENGLTRILVYMHADAPGTRWARALSEGDTCVIFGPRKSIDRSQLRGPVIFFGDETSLGVATALFNHASSPAAQMLFEVSTIADAKPVVEQLRLNDAHLCARIENDRHFAELETYMSAFLQDHATADIVLTGKATSIQHITRLLRQRAIGAVRRQSKAYWAPGKTGLD
ncbi:MAG: siderophore-interacting protein [Steroidobacter sp.]